MKIENESNTNMGAKDAPETTVVASEVEVEPKAKAKKLKVKKLKAKTAPAFDPAALTKPSDLNLPTGTLKPTDSRIPTNGTGFYFASPGSIIINEEILVRGKVKDSDEKFEALCDSIKKWGVLEPLVCRRTKDNKLELVMGRQRLAASKRAGLKAVPYVLTAGSDGECVMKGIDENVARIEMNCVDEARAVLRAKELTKVKTNVELGRIMAKTPRWIAQHLELLEIPAELLDLISKRKDGSVTIGKVHQIMRLAPKYRAEYVARMASLTEKGLRDLIEKREEKGEIEFAGGKSKPRPSIKKAKSGGQGNVTVKGEYTKTYKSKGGEIKIDVLPATKIEALIEDEEKALKSESLKKKPNAETVAYHKGRISAFLQAMMLDPKASSLDEALAKFDK